MIEAWTHREYLKWLRRFRSQRAALCCDEVSNEEVCRAILAVPRHFSTKHSTVYNGSNQYIDMGNVLSYKTGNIHESISFGTWIKGTLTGTAGYAIVGRNVFGNKGYRYGINVNDAHNPQFGAVIQLDSTTANPTDTADSWNDGTWHFLSISGTTNVSYKLYFDGNLKATVASADAIIVADNTTRFLLGCADDGSGGQTAFFTGKIAQPFCVIGTAITATQHANLAAGTLDPSGISGASYWYGYEGSGNTIADQGNGNTGTLNNNVSNNMWDADIPSQIATVAFPFPAPPPVSQAIKRASYF